MPQIYSIFVRDMNVVGIRPLEISAMDEYSEARKKRSLIFKPGLLSVFYVIPERFDSCTTKDEVDKLKMAIERLYIMKKKKKSIKTDIEFGYKILSNIIFKGLRSS